MSFHNTLETLSVGHLLWPILKSILPPLCFYKSMKACVLCQSIILLCSVISLLVSKRASLVHVTVLSHLLVALVLGSLPLGGLHHVGRSETVSGLLIAVRLTLKLGSVKRRSHLLSCSRLNFFNWSRVALCDCVGFVGSRGWDGVSGVWVPRWLDMEWASVLSLVSHGPPIIKTAIHA